MYKDTSPQAAFLRQQVKTCVKGDIMGLWIYGRGGVGKSTIVCQHLEELLGVKDVDWQYRQGGDMSAGGLFETLSEWRNQVIFLDDMANILRIQKAKQMLLAAWGTTGKRSISHIVKKETQTFIFTGKVIFLANNEMSASDAVGGAILSRIRQYYYDPPDEHVADLMRHIAALGYTSTEGKKLKPKHCKEVCEFYIKECKNLNLHNDCRDMVPKGYSDYQLWLDGCDFHWKEVGLHFLRQRSGELKSIKMQPRATKAEDKEQQRQLLARIMEEGLTEREQIEQFCAESKMAVATYYRRKKELQLADDYQNLKFAK